MSQKMTIAFGCYFVSVIVMLAFGITYLFRSEFMPYHAIAAGVPWAELPPRLQALVLAFMKALGGVYVAASIATLAVLFFPFRQGARWAIWFIPAFGTLVSLATLNAMRYLASHTPATPPWVAPLAALALVAIGWLFSITDRKRNAIAA